MNSLFAIFLLQGADTTPSAPIMTSNVREWLIIGGATLAVSLLIGLFCLIALRPKPHRSRRHQRPEREPVIENAVHDETRPRRRRRHRHGDNLPRNPTLAETGGLPPVRDERTRRGLHP